MALGIWSGTISNSRISGCSHLNLLAFGQEPGKLDLNALSLSIVILEEINFYIL